MTRDAGSVPLDILGVRGARGAPRRDPVVVEEPLELRLDGEPLAVTMRTPGDDLELAAGFLVSEGIVADLDALVSIAHCDESRNVVEARSSPGAQGVRPPPARRFAASSACGVCGKATLDDLRTRAPALHADAARVSAAWLATLPARLREAQPLFSATGALHGAALFLPTGELARAREDVGRHNAVDKVIGWAALERSLPLRGCTLLVSGRLGFEIAQKALVAGIPVVAAVSGPSSLAVELARDYGMTLVAFLRGDALNVYAGAERITYP